MLSAQALQLTLLVVAFSPICSFASEESSVPNDDYTKAVALITENNSAQNHTAIKEYLEKAASENSVPAIQKLAEFYYFGDSGFPKSSEHAVYYAKIGSGLNNAWCQNLLGTMYESGQGVQLSKSSAIFWYTEAAKQGLAKAQSNLGLILRSNSPSREDELTAFVWLTLAANQNEITAIKQLGGFAHTITPAEKAIADIRIAEIKGSIRTGADE